MEPSDSRQVWSVMRSLGAGGSSSRFRYPSSQCSIASARPSLTIASVAIGPWFDSPPRNSGPVAASLVSPSSSTSLADASYIIVSSLYSSNAISFGRDILGFMGEEIPDEMDVLRALAHPVRWGILQRLAAEPGICACDFTEFFDVSQPTISRT